MDYKKHKNQSVNENEKIAPGIDEEDSYGEDASKEDKEEGETTKVTRLIYDEYDHS
ncbi:hypothetical protein [Salipaludibacillus daqingensis]|uniref:hypothetical protein n=1 Tax=Salipaludibacillus daqingensis TaxID=3041001 RepID=UPI00247349CD|nr:hypothetical protein [Salipaludibacillus daqingensis]